MASKTTKLIDAAVTFAAVATIAKLTRSPLLTFLANSLLARIPGLEGGIRQVDLSLTEPKLIVHDLSVLYRLNGRAQRLKLRSFELEAQWKQLLRGAIEARSRVDAAELWLRLAPSSSGDDSHARGNRIAKRAKDRNEKRADESSWPRRIRQLPPIKIDSLTFTNCAIRLELLPIQPSSALLVQDLNLRAANLVNSKELRSSLLAKASGRARLMTSGDLAFSAEGYPLAEMPTFNIDMTVTNLALNELHDWLEELATIDVKRGVLNFSLEAAAAHGEIHGYVKPTFDHLQIEPPQPAGFFAKTKAYLVKLLAKIGRNRRKDRVATRIDFDGAFDAPDFDIWGAIGAFVRNGFMTAERASLEHRIWFARAGRSADEVRIHYGPKKHSTLGSTLGLFKAALSRWNADSASRMAAALAYYMAFSVAPVLLLAITIAGFAFGRDAVQGKIVEQISGLVGTHSAETIQSMIQAAYRPGQGVIASIVSIVTLLFGAIGVFSELKAALNQIWRTEESGSVKEIVKKNVVFLGMMLGIGLLLAVSLIISTAIAAVGAYFGSFLPARQSILQFLNFAFSFGVVTILFAAIYRILPNTDIEWRDVWVGAAVTSLLFNLGKLGLGLYLGRSAVASEYGAAGSILIFLLWVYYSGLIFYYGAEFTAVYSESHGSRVGQQSAA
jgi:membrane protein